MKTNKKIITAVVVLFSLIGMGGCQWFMGLFEGDDKSVKIPPVERITKEISESEKIVDKAESQVGKSAKKIKEEAVEIKEKTETVKEELSVESKPKVEPLLEKIDDNADNIIDEADKLKFTQGKLALAIERLDNAQKLIKERSKALGKLEKDYEKVLAENVKLKDAESKKTAAMMRWLILFSIVGMGGSAVLLFYGNKIGIATGIACGVTLVLAITISQHVVLISWIGIGVVVIIAAILIREVWKHKKAITEIVKTAEVTKVELSKESSNRVFGGGKEKGVAGEIQSKSTEQVVAKEREKLDKVWNFMKKKAETLPTTTQDVPLTPPVLSPRPSEIFVLSDKEENSVSIR